MELNENQINFILTFFKDSAINENCELISRQLITKGEVIVGGTTRIYQGGVGNFIETSSPSNVFNSLRYTFDLKYFLDTSFFKNNLEIMLNKLSNEKQAIEIKINDLYTLK